MKVKMINSVGEYEAGRTYTVGGEMGDRLIVLGAAEGELSDEMTDEMREEILAQHQVVNLDG